MKAILPPKKYVRRHLIPPLIKNEIRLIYAKKYLNLIDPDIIGKSVLIIGAGSSAEPEKVSLIAKEYDVTITINSAFFIFPSATFNSFEFATKDSVMCHDMIKWIDVNNYKKLIIKPHSLWPISRNNIRFLKEKQKEIANKIGVFENKKPILKGLLQHHYPGYTDVNNYLPLIKRSRRLYQWHGSLSVWLDSIHRSKKISRLGLIGTDFGGPYSSVARWFKPSSVSEKHLLQKDRSLSGGPLPFLTILSFLCEHGYLNNVKVDHYHYSYELKSILSI